MKRFALQHGQAIAMLGNDDAKIVTRQNGKTASVTYPASGIRWKHD
jgi:hypothetical protein